MPPTHEFTTGAAFAQPLSDRAEDAAESQYDKNAETKIDVEKKVKQLGTRVLATLDFIGFIAAPFGSLRNLGFVLYFGSNVAYGAKHLDADDLDQATKIQKISTVVLSVLGLIGTAASVPALVTASLIGLVGLSAFKAFKAYDEGNTDGALKEAVFGIAQAGLLGLHVTGRVALWALGAVGAGTAALYRHYESIKVSQENVTSPEVEATPTP